MGDSRAIGDWFPGLAERLVSSLSKPKRSSPDQGPRAMNPLVDSAHGPAILVSSVLRRSGRRLGTVSIPRLLLAPQYAVDFDRLNDVLERFPAEWFQAVAILEASHGFGAGENLA